MASLLRRGIETGRGFTINQIQLRCVTTKMHREKMNRDRKIGPKIDSTGDSLAAKGFLRPQKSYRPNENTLKVVESLCLEILGTVNSNASIKTKKFELLEACFTKLKHGIPNNILHEIETVDNIKQFYLTPVNDITPFEAMKNVELPKNLYIRHEYHRFHPETDTMFGGVSAFPESSTLVTGLKYKKKYRGHTAKTAWP